MSRSLPDAVTVRLESSVPSIESVVPSTVTPVVALISTAAAEVISTSPEFEDVIVTPVCPSTVTVAVVESIVKAPPSAAVRTTDSLSSPWSAFKVRVTAPASAPVKVTPEPVTSRLPVKACTSVLSLPNELEPK